MLDRNAILTRLTKAREDIDFVIDALWCDSEPGQGATFGIRLSVVGGGPVTENSPRRSVSLRRAAIRA